MSSAILLDTSIILDMALPGRPEHEAAVLLANEVADNVQLSAYVAATSLKDAYYVLSRGGNEAPARQYIRQAIDFFELAAVDADICRLASASDEPDFEDGIIRACAERVGVDYIISRDAGAYARSAIRRLSAREYVDLFCKPEPIAW